MDKKEEAQKKEEAIYVLPSGKIAHIEDCLSKGKIANIVDFLFVLPVINPDEKEEGLMPSIYVDKKGDKHRWKKISHNSPQAIDCVEYGYKTWKEKNRNNNIDQWRKNIIDMLNTFTEQTKDKTLKLKIGAYINLVDLFVYQEKKEKEKQEKYSSNDQRLYSLNILCPDFIKSMSKLSKKRSGEILSIITNANPVDCYKKIITGTGLKVDDEFKDKIKQFKSDIEK